MVCPHCGDECNRSHQYLGQSFHFGLTERVIGRLCSKCGKTYTTYQRNKAESWYKRPQRPPDNTMDIPFPETHEH